MCLIYEKYVYTFCGHTRKPLRLFDVDFCTHPNGIPARFPDSPYREPIQACPEKDWDHCTNEVEDFCYDCKAELREVGWRRLRHDHQVDPAVQVELVDGPLDGQRVVWTCGHTFIAFEPESLQHCFSPGTPRRVEHNVRTWESHRNSRLVEGKKARLELKLEKRRDPCPACQRKYTRELFNFWEREAVNDGGMLPDSDSGFRRRKPAGLAILIVPELCPQCEEEPWICTCEKMIAVRPGEQGVDELYDIEEGEVIGQGQQHLAMEWPPEGTPWGSEMRQEDWDEMNTELRVLKGTVMTMEVDLDVSEDNPFNSGIF